MKWTVYRKAGRSVLIMLLLLLILMMSGCKECWVDANELCSGEQLNRIINGSAAEEAATKHQVSLRRRRKDSYRFGAGHICGGSLIKPNVVLTAAHCFVDQAKYDGSFLAQSDFIVVVGSTDRFKQTEHTLVFDVRERVMQLTKFNLSTYSKDIALLLLSGSVPQCDARIQPIGLTNTSFQPETSCQVTGWGRTEKGYNSDILLSVTVPLISEWDCKSKSNLSQHLIKPGMMCAGYLNEGERDACTGDSGGPLVCAGQLAGIISWGIKCGVPRLPGVYTDVAYYRQWIDDTLKGYEYPKHPRNSNYDIRVRKRSDASRIIYGSVLNHIALIAVLGYFWHI